MADQFTLQHGGSDQFLEQWGIVPQPAIPTPESTDNGKVLGVSEGQYALVNGGGGGAEPLIVNATEAGIDATYNELKAAILAGKTIWEYYAIGDDTFYTPLLQLYTANSEYVAVFGVGGDTYAAEDADTDLAYDDGGGSGGGGDGGID